MVDKIKPEFIFRRYLQNDLRKVDFPFFFQASVRFILDLGIWIDPEVYKRLPIFEPIAYRDQKSQYPVDRRGQANTSSALLIDDNSYVKNFAKGKIVSSNKISYYDGKALNNGFWACHIWDKIGPTMRLSNEDNTLFTFIPNIVWLPKEFSRLSDIPGSPIKDILKQLSLNLYSDVKMGKPALQSIVDASWDKLLENPHNQIIPIKSLPSIDDYNLLKIHNSTIDKKKIRHEDFSEALIDHGSGLPITTRWRQKMTTYGGMIDQIDTDAAFNLGTWLEGYLNALP